MNNSQGMNSIHHDERLLTVLQHLSHDMKEPMAAILASCSQFHSATSSQAQLIEAIRKNTRLTLMMMDDCIFKIAAQAEHYQLWDVLFDSIFDQAVFATRQLATECNIEIEVHQSCITAFVHCEPKLLEGALVRLLSGLMMSANKDSVMVIQINLDAHKPEALILHCRILSSSQSLDQTKIAIDEETAECIKHIIRRHHGTIIENSSNKQAGERELHLTLPCFVDCGPEGDYT